MILDALLFVDMIKFIDDSSPDGSFHSIEALQSAMFEYENNNFQEPSP